MGQRLPHVLLLLRLQLLFIGEVFLLPLSLRSDYYCSIYESDIIVYVTTEGIGTWYVLLKQFLRLLQRYPQCLLLYYDNNTTRSQHLAASKRSTQCKGSVSMIERTPPYLFTDVRGD